MRTATVSNSPGKWVVLPHYAFAALAFVALSVLLLFSTDAFGGHYFHPKLLTLTHVAVLGWATMLIFGALYQLLPVVLVFVVSGSDLRLPPSLLSSIYLIYGITVFLGFVTALILGQTFKTLPFIVWMHAYEDYVGRFKTPLPKDLYSHNLQRWQNISYLLGFLLLVAGVLLRQQEIILAGAIAFIVTAVLYMINVFSLLLHKVHDLKPFPYGNASA